MAEIYENMVQRIEEFPTLPTIYHTLTEVIANPHSTPSDVAKVVSQDQSAVSKVLKAANSSIYGFRGRVSTITQAIVYIGFEEVKQLVAALSIIDLFSKVQPYGSLNPVDLWKHSIGVGVITRHIGRQIGVKSLESYFIAGILHDIGKLIFYRYIPEKYSQIVNHARENGLQLREAEYEMLGITHTVIGNLLAEKWRLPAVISHAIAHHYIGKVDGKINQLVGSVHIANIVASFMELGYTGDDMIPRPNIDVWDDLNLPPNVFTSLMQQILSDYNESVHLLISK